MTGAVLRVSREHGKLLLCHHRLHILAEFHDLLCVRWCLEVILLVHPQTRRPFRLGLGPHALIVESYVLVQLLLDFHDSVLESGERRWRFLI